MTESKQDRHVVLSSEDGGESTKKLSRIEYEIKEARINQDHPLLLSDIAFSLVRTCMHLSEVFNFNLTEEKLMNLEPEVLRLLRESTLLQSLKLVTGRPVVTGILSRLSEKVRGIAQSYNHQDIKWFSDLYLFIRAAIKTGYLLSGKSVKESEELTVVLIDQTAVDKLIQAGDSSEVYLSELIDSLPQVIRLDSYLMNWEAKEFLSLKSKRHDLIKTLKNESFEKKKDVVLQLFLLTSDLRRLQRLKYEEFKKFLRTETEKLTAMRVGFYGGIPRYEEVVAGHKAFFTLREKILVKTKISKPTIREKISGKEGKQETVMDDGEFISGFYLKSQAFLDLFESIYLAVERAIAGDFHSNPDPQALEQNKNGRNYFRQRLQDGSFIARVMKGKETGPLDVRIAAAYCVLMCNDAEFRGDISVKRGYVHDSVTTCFRWHSKLQKIMTAYPEIFSQVTKGNMELLLINKFFPQENSVMKHEVHEVSDNGYKDGAVLYRLSKALPNEINDLVQRLRETNEDREFLLEPESNDESYDKSALCLKVKDYLETPDGQKLREQYEQIKQLSSLLTGSVLESMQSLTREDLDKFIERFISKNASAANKPGGIDIALIEKQLKHSLEMADPLALSLTHLYGLSNSSAALRLKYSVIIEEHGNGRGKPRINKKTLTCGSYLEFMSILQKITTKEPVLDCYISWYDSRNNRNQTYDALIDRIGMSNTHKNEFLSGLLRQLTEPVRSLYNAQNQEIKLEVADGITDLPKILYDHQQSVVIGYPENFRLDDLIHSYETLLNFNANPGNSIAKVVRAWGDAARSIRTALRTALKLEAQPANSDMQLNSLFFGYSRSIDRMSVLESDQTDAVINKISMLVVYHNYLELLEGTDNKISADLEKVRSYLQKALLRLSVPVDVTGFTLPIIQAMRPRLAIAA